jgi:hypothetical protein
MIKSQQDIKNANKAKADKVPKSMENKTKDPPVDMENTSQPIVPLIKRVETIEEYLGKVDVAFEKVVIELTNLKKMMQIMDNEISKITGDIVRISKLEEERYIELATGVNHLNDKITTLDEYIPVFIDKRLDEYFEAISTDIEPDEKPNDEETPKE